MSRGDARTVRAEGEAVPLIGGELGASGQLRLDPLAAGKGLTLKTDLRPRRALPRSLIGVGMGGAGAKVASFMGLAA